MVYTRPQARAAASAEAANTAVSAPALPVDREHTVTEVQDKESFALVPAAQMPLATHEYSFEKQVSKMVDHLWSQTQRLAAEATILQTNQHQQAQKYHAALMVVQDDARSNGAALAAHHNWIECQIEAALEGAKTVLKQELHVLANAQAVGNEAVHVFVLGQLQDTPNKAHQEALETKRMITAHAIEEGQLEKCMSAVVESAHESLVHGLTRSLRGLSRNCKKRLEKGGYRVGADAATSSHNVPEDGGGGH